jgi:hypothetical protein
MSAPTTRREHAFCTVVDRGYLPRLLVLHRSLEDLCQRFRLHVLCIDASVQPLLDGLQRSQIVTHPLEEIEAADPALRDASVTRTRLEYCWTLKPSLCLQLLEDPNVAAVTYLDSDLMFFEDPDLVIRELGDGSIAILPHRFPPWRAHWKELDGIYNGAWLTFRADERALAALRWWRERCLEWCYNRREEGKFADQHYLDDWPERFHGVHAVAHPGAGLAPWNSSQHELERANGGVRVDGEPVVFYHYQSLRLLRAPAGLRRLTLRSHGYRFLRDPSPLLWWTNPEYALPEREVELLWRPYLRGLVEALSELRAREPGFDDGLTPLPLGELLGQLARRLTPRPARRLARRPTS